MEEPVKNRVTKMYDSFTIQKDFLSFATRINYVIALFLEIMIDNMHNPNCESFCMDQVEKFFPSDQFMLISNHCIEKLIFWKLIDQETFKLLDRVQWKKPFDQLTFPFNIFRVDQTKRMETQKLFHQPDNPRKWLISMLFDFVSKAFAKNDPPVN